MDTESDGSHMNGPDADETTTPRRRRFLVTAGGAMSAFLAGCVSGDDGNDDERDGADGGSTDGEDDADGTDGTDGSEDGTGDGDGESTPDDGGDTTPNDGEGDGTPDEDDTPMELDDLPEAKGDPPTSQLSGEAPESCPEYDRVIEVVCYDTADVDDVAGYLEPASETVALGEQVDFTLRNESDRGLETNFYDWALHKYVDGEWYHVDPQEVNDPLMRLEPGDSHTWSLTVENDSVLAGESIPRTSGTDEISVHGLGGGYYAFRGRGWFEDESYEDAVAFAGTFELEAEPIPLVPTETVEAVGMDGETLVTESSRGDDDQPLAAYELERVEDRDAEQTLITEQVYRSEQLRDTLAFLFEYEVDRVRLEEPTGSVPPFAMSPDGRFTFQGETFEVTAEELE